MIMEVGNIRLYKDRWRVVEEIERQELRAMTVSEHWQKLNAIVRFALETGMDIEKDDREAIAHRPKDLDQQRVEEWVKALGKALEFPDLCDQIKLLLRDRD